MDRFDRMFQLHRLLASRRTPISRQSLQERLECSRATVGRAIEDMRDFLNAPIIYDRTRNGYYYDNNPASESFELPGLWFNANEILALLTTHQLLREIQPGLLDSYISPFLERIEKLLTKRQAGCGEIAQRVRIMPSAARPTDVEHFRVLTTALINRYQIRVLYHGRERDRTTERTLSPQRLIYYRDNWYLDAWCHLRQGLRTFSLDRLHPIATGERAKAKDVSEKTLDTHFAHTYGIFDGAATHVAKLRFTANATKWVADEHWHPEQRSQVMPNGELLLQVPYGNPKELIHDILKYGPEIEVIGPESLRKAVAAALQQACKQYK